MPKLKTRKTVSKRFKITKSKKFLHRKAGQDHFNAREPGKIVLKKRKDVPAARVHLKALKKLIPYH